MRMRPDTVAINAFSLLSIRSGDGFSKAGMCIAIQPTEFETEFALREEGAGDEKQKFTNQVDRSGLRGF